MRVIAVALLAGVVALAVAQISQALGGEGLLALLGAAILLEEGADRADLEARRLAERYLAAHRGGAVRAAQQIEPQQDAGTAGGVDLAALQRVPDRAAIAAFGVHGDQAARVHEAGAALDVEQLPEALRAGDDLGGALRILRAASRDPADPAGEALGARAPGVGHPEPVPLLVARTGAAAVVVAGGDEAPAKTERAAVRVELVEVREGGAVLRAHAGAQGVRGLEAVAALVAVEPVLLAGVGDDPLRLGARLHHQPLRLLDAALALLRREVAAALADQLAGAPAAGQVVGARLGADALAAVASSSNSGTSRNSSLLPWPEKVSSRIWRSGSCWARSSWAPRFPPCGACTPQARPCGITIVSKPHCASFSNSSPGVGAFSRQSSGSSRVSRPTSQLGRPASCCTRQRKSAYSAQPDVAQHLKAGQEPEALGAFHHVVLERGDRPPRELVLGEAREHHVLVSVVGFRRAADLRPLPAHEGHQVGVRPVAGALVALAQALLAGGPHRGGERLGVVVEREEVELRAVAGEVAGVGRRVRALAGEDRQRVDEGVDRVRGVHVEIAEQDALAGRRVRAGGEGAARRGFRIGQRVARGVGAPRALDGAGVGLVAAAGETRDQRESEQDRPGGHGGRAYWKPARAPRSGARDSRQPMSADTDPGRGPR